MAISPVRTARVVAAPIVTTIRVSGQTAARDFANIVAPRMVGPESNRPLILLRLIPTGTMVKKGDVIAEIDGQSLADHADDVHSTVVQAEADVKKRKAEQEVERVNLQQNVLIAKSTFDKMRVDAGAAEIRTAIDQELIKLDLEEAGAAHKQLAEEVPLKRDSQSAELKILDYTRDRHARHRDRHRRDVTRFTIHAPMDGMAVTQSIFRGGEFLPIGEGDQVYPGQLILKVVNRRTMQVEGTINQAEIGNFRIGQTAKVTLDAFPGLDFTGKVHSIGAIAVGGRRQQSYIRNIPIQVMIEQQHERLIPDLSAAADVKIASTESDATVPLAAIHTENGKSVAYVRQGGRFVRREVELGAHNNIQVAVLAGLSVDEEVALNYEPSAAK